ncbi:MAG TPA: HAMP domain-containing sensor histidine kinase [Herpetosiphonaceae bacterium]
MNARIQHPVDMRERLWLLRTAALMLGIASIIALPIVLLNPLMTRLNLVNCCILMIFSIVAFTARNQKSLLIGGYGLAGALIYCISTLPGPDLMDSPLGTTYIIAIAIGGITGGARGIWILLGTAVVLFVSLGIAYSMWTINSSTALFTIVMTGLIVGIIMHSLERALKDANRLVDTEQQLQIERNFRMLIRSLQHELQAQANGVRGLVALARGVADGSVNLTESWDGVVLGGLEGRAQRLDTMMQHLLVIAQGKLPEEFQLVSLRGLISDLVKESSVWQYQIPVTIRDEIAEDAVIRCIPAYLLMALDTVVRNAIEAGSRSGKARVDISISTSVDGHSVLLCIQDDGPGFPPAVIRQINSAERGDLSMLVPSAKGIGGLGLNLLRAIVLWHHGSVKIGNNGGSNKGGAWVNIFLPLP